MLIRIVIDLLGRYKRHKNLEDKKGSSLKPFILQRYYVKRTTMAQCPKM